MRLLRIVSGACVLFTSLAYGHLLHHHLTHSAREDFRHPVFWAAVLPALAAGILSFVGGFLLLKGSR